MNDKHVDTIKKILEIMNNRIMEQQKVIDDLNRRLQKFETIHKAQVDEEGRCNDLYLNFMDDDPNN